MSTYLPIMSILSRTDSHEIQVTEEITLIEKGSIPSGIVMLMRGKVQCLKNMGEEIPFPQNRRIWGVKEVWSDAASTFWLRALPGSSYRIVPKTEFLRLLREEPQLRLDVMKMLTSELGAMTIHVTA
jgi:CRP-like cAMP-binding protein